MQDKNLMRLNQYVTRPTRAFFIFGEKKKVSPRQ
jgi:hypothetical protein